MKNYRFGKLANRYYIGFGMLDTDKKEFVSLDGFHPYVLKTKKLIESCIYAEFDKHFTKRVAHS